MQHTIILNNRLRMLLVAFLGLALMLIMAPKAKAATFEVTPTSDCTIEEAFATINNDAPEPGCPGNTGDYATNTINLATGTYPLTSYLYVNNGASLTMTGAGMGQTVIDGGSSGNEINIISSVATPTNIQFSNLTFMKTLVTLYVAGGTVKVNNSTFSQCGSEGCLQINNTGNGELTPIIENNIFTDSIALTSTLIQNLATGALNATLSNNAYVSNNVIAAIAIIPAQPNEEEPIQVGPINATLTNNTVSGNGTVVGAVAIGNLDGISGQYEVNASFINNTIANNTKYAPMNPASVGASGKFSALTKFKASEEPTVFGIIGAGEGTTIGLINNIISDNADGNCFISNGVNFVSSGGNISSDGSCSSFLNNTNDKNDTPPLLQDLAEISGTYVMPITQSSPAFNNGVATNAPATDQRGVARPQGGAYDSGAYELIAATTDPASNTNSLAKTGNDARIPALVASLMLILGLSGFMVASRRR